MTRLMTKIAIALGVVGGAMAGAGAPPPSLPSTAVRVANLVYGGGHTGKCFASGYLDLLARETTIKVERMPAAIELATGNLYDFPFAVMTGEGSFTLGDDEVERLRTYLERGGFLLASAGCSNAEWDESFRREMARVMPYANLTAIPLDHELFRTVFSISHLQTKNLGGEAPLWGIQLEGRLAVLYSPEGLNDTGNAGGGCCCCGGNEIRNAKYINANALAYALQN